MNRRGFLGMFVAGAAAAASAPVFVRAASLDLWKPTARLVLPGTASWLSAVREVMQYDICRDEYLVRYDVMCSNGVQLNCCGVLTGRETTLPPRTVRGKLAQLSFDGPNLERVREPALQCLEDAMRHDGLWVDRERRLELPEGLPPGHSRFLG